MAHNEHNKPKKSGAYFLIILGALLFIIAPTWFKDTPELGLALIALGFVVGGFGFYLRFVRK
jgi:vacuolar-type H+-ATPase subunit I/STV1